MRFIPLIGQGVGAAVAHRVIGHKAKPRKTQERGDLGHSTFDRGQWLIGTDGDGQSVCEHPNFPEISPPFAIFLIRIFCTYLRVQT